ncbi:hypothetical protein CL619_03995 [archaeon]|jgi:hypothetical protein|nr:hypothetical protein [archaeon]|tara:strand:- start:2992 stop:3378 length:387 start_codon:yes stop_codon:yes gene_type:complete
MEKNWKKEIARDAIAFGSILFYFIVIIRAIIGKYMPFVYQLLIAISILIILSFIIKNANQHIARVVPLVVFTSLFYNDNLFTIFVILLFLVMIISAFYIKEKKEVIVKGVVLGVVAALGAYYLNNLIV